MASLAEVFVNDYPLSNFGFRVEKPGQWQDSPDFDPQIAPLVSRAGGIIANPYLVLASARLLITGSLRQATMPLFNANLNAMKSLLFRGPIELRFVDEPDKLYWVMTRGVKRLDREQPALVDPTQFFSVEFTLPDPLRYSLLPSIVAIRASGVAVPMPQGTATCAPIIRLRGPAVNPVITQRSADGTSRGTMTLTVTLAASDYVEINCDTLQIRQSIAGVVTDGISLLSAGDFVYFDAFGNDYVNSVWPTLSISSGTAQVFYRRTWL